MCLKGKILVGEVLLSYFFTVQKIENVVSFFVYPVWSKTEEHWTSNGSLFKRVTQENVGSEPRNFLNGKMSGAVPLLKRETFLVPWKLVCGFELIKKNLAASWKSSFEIFAPRAGGKQNTARRILQFLRQKFSFRVESGMRDPRNKNPTSKQYTDCFV